MAYRNFNEKILTDRFNIEKIETSLLDFDKISKIEPSNNLITSLSEAGLITLSSDLAISAQIIAPILVESKKVNDNFQIFSGETVVGDKGLGLNGIIDFIFAKTPITSIPNTPIFFLLKQSKPNKLNAAFPKAIAQMLGVRHFNKDKGSEIETIHSVVTDGTIWRFLKLEDNKVFIDSTIYSTENLPSLLGILQDIINFYKK